MNLILTAHNWIMLAGGSIAGDKKPLDSSEYLGVTFAGIGIVLLALALLVVIIMLFGKIFDGINKSQQTKEKAAAAAKAPKASPTPAKKPEPAKAVQPPAPAPVVSAEDDDEVIAVISAVVAMMSEQDGTTYEVKSVKQKQPRQGGFSGRSAWAMDGRRNNISPF